MFLLPCPTFRLPFLRCCVAIPWLRRITPNATENQILILVPRLQGGGSAFGDRVPKRHLLHPIRLPRSTGDRGCYRAGLWETWFEEWWTYPAKWLLSNAALPGSASFGSALFQGCSSAAVHHPEAAVAWHEMMTVPGHGSLLAQHPP